MFAILALPAQSYKTAHSKKQHAEQSQPTVRPMDAPNKQPGGGADEAKASSNSPVDTTVQRPARWWAKPDWWVVLVAGLTGLVIGWQSWETRKAAEAATRGLTVGISKERAKIFIEQVPADWTFLSCGYERKMTEDLRFGIICNEIDSFHFAMTNDGESTAYNAVCKCSVTVVDTKGREIISKTSEETIGRFRKDIAPIRHGIDFYPAIPQETLDLIHNKAATLRFFGWVHYENAFDSNSRHETLFSYVWRIGEEWIGDREGFADTSGWETYPPEENRQT